MFNIIFYFSFDLLSLFSPFVLLLLFAITAKIDFFSTLCCKQELESYNFSKIVSLSYAEISHILLFVEQVHDMFEEFHIGSWGGCTSTGNGGLPDITIQNDPFSPF